MMYGITLGKTEGLCLLTTNSWKYSNDIPKQKTKIDFYCVKAIIVVISLGNSVKIATCNQ